MKKLIPHLLLPVLALVLIAITASAQDANEIMKKSHLAYYYAGNDGLAEVTMTLTDKRGKERVREFTMLRRDESDGGNQEYYTYFKKPSDVSRLTFMVHKMTDGNDLRWLYVPSVDLVKPISADDKNSSFVGSDFTYEDVSGRRWTEDNHTYKGEQDLNGTAVYVIESVPKEPYKGFARKVSYIDKDNFLPLKEEYYDSKNNLERIFTAEKVDTVDGIPTVTIRKMDNVQKKSFTTVDFTSIKYNVGIEADVFSERYLKTPPRKYIH
ncbi:MAG TPA: outer membrane lipoprotein-sorting protein [candidate division Zixibacteria bacterium]|nr:outer membrane lipoprotein-sorting protein [candidate division Zixibacteria bacterium]